MNPLPAAATIATYLLQLLEGLPVPMPDVGKIIAAEDNYRTAFLWLVFGSLVVLIGAVVTTWKLLMSAWERETETAKATQDMLLKLTASLTEQTTLLKTLPGFLERFEEVLDAGRKDCQAKIGDIRDRLLVTLPPPHRKP